MAEIREELVLYDRFTQTFTSYIRQGERAADVTERAQAAAQGFSVASAQAAASTRANTAALKSQESQTKKTKTQTDMLSNSIRRMAGGFLGLQAVRGIINLSDSMTAATARLDMMNDGLQTTAQLNDMIFESANRSRGSYQATADLVGKLGILAGNAFSSSAEIVAFAEQVNKQMAIAGTSAYGAEAAMLQLTQAMASGVLRGEELNSILEQAPTIAQSIADYLGVDVGAMRQLASEGKITASVVKAAIFAAADETNAKFEEMPYTFSQAWSVVKNVLTQAFQPLLNGLSAIADFAGNNIDIVVGAIYGLAAAATFYAAAQWIATDAAKAFFTALKSNPLMWIAMLIGVIVAAVYSWIQSVGGLQTAWAICQNWLLTAWDNIKIAFFTVVYAIQEWGAKLQLAFTKVTNAIANAVDWMKAQVLTGIQGMVNGAIDLINDFIAALNKIPGVSIEAIEHVTFGTEAQLQYEANKQARAEEVAKMQAELDQMVADHKTELQNMRAERDAAQAAREQEIAEMQAEAAGGTSGGSDYEEEIAANTGAAAGSAGAIEKSLGLAEEELKSLVDVAEQRYVNRINLTSQTPVININGANTGNTQADRQRLADQLRDVLLEQMSAGSSRSTSFAYSGVT